MIIDFLNSNNYMSYNISLAKLLGLECAVYLSSLLIFYSDAIKRNKLDEDGYFSVNRAKIEDVTTFDSKKQNELDNRLKSVNIINLKSNHSKILIDCTMITSLLMNEDENLVKQLTIAAKKPRTKNDAIKLELKSHIKNTNGELRDAYSKWIDAVIAKLGWMSVVAVEEGEKTVDEFAKRNLDVALEIINISAMNGYRDMKWAIKSYKENYTNKVHTPSQPVQLSSEVF